MTPAFSTTATGLGTYQLNFRWHLYLEQRQQQRFLRGTADLVIGLTQKQKTNSFKVVEECTRPS